MPTSTPVTGGVRIDFEDGNPSRLIRVVPGGPGQATVEIADATTGEMLAMPHTLKGTDSGGRIASEPHGVDPLVCITDSATGFIANG